MLSCNCITIQFDAVGVVQVGPAALKEVANGEEVLVDVEMIVMNTSVVVVVAVVVLVEIVVVPMIFLDFQY